LPSWKTNMSSGKKTESLTATSHSASFSEISNIEQGSH
jgi:hypothetical protein